jgi:hypothetical protein
MKTLRLVFALFLALFAYTSVVHVSGASAQQVEQDAKEVTVYVTDTGKRYHRDGCRYLAYSKHAIALKDAVARGYTPCHVCKPPVLR